MGKHFEQARHDAMHEIEFINYELGRMGREAGKKPERKAALKKFIEIIDMYNAEQYEAIASLVQSNDTQSDTPKTKQSEIDTINSLMAMDGYFAEYFKQDAEKMVENIKNDFPIEMETSFGEKDSMHQIKIQDIGKVLLQCAHAFNEISLLKEAIQLLGHEWVVRFKLQNDMQLWDLDKEFLINKL